MENAIFRIVQESVTNARRHSRSKNVRIELVQHGPLVRMVVQDWGVGFDPAVVGEGNFGLAGIRQRARLLGGTAKIESSPGQGTRVRVELPVVGNEGRPRNGGSQSPALN